MRLHHLPLLTAFLCTLPAARAAPGDVDPLNANVGGSYLNTTAVQPDGKTIIAGKFTSVLGIPRNNVARLNADGTLDAGFDPKPNAPVDSVVVQADGKILLAGEFTALQPNGAGAPAERVGIARVNTDGTLDTGFNPRLDDGVNCVAVQADGKVLLGGYFTALQPAGAAATLRQYIARVNADGTLDTGFDPGANSEVLGVTLQADGEVLLSGNFTALQPNGAGTPTLRKNFTRLQNDPATQTLTAPDATQILWQRGGAAPELSQVTFELSTSGGASWTPLGAGARIGTSANWQITGLSLPIGGQLRAQGVTSGGNRNGSSGMIEQTVTFPSFSADTDGDGLRDAWELTHWPTTAGHSALDDYDHDGYIELLELALGLNPTVANPGGLPAVVNEGGYLTMTITKQPGATYEVQSAGTLLPALSDSFSATATTILINDATTLKVRDNFLIGTGPRRFMRAKVTAAP